MKRSRPVSLALVGLFLWVTGCHSYRQIQVGELADHDRVIVTSVSAGSTEIRDPFVEADSVRGTIGDYDYAIPLTGVEKLEAVGTNATGTVFAVLGIAVVATVLAVGIYCAVEDPEIEIMGQTDRVC